jgi:hypothetical protein
MSNSYDHIVPLRYRASYEIVEEDEATTIEGLKEALLHISETTLQDSGHASRSVHLKSHGILRAELRVLDGLPPMLAQGMFSVPTTYPVVMRLSTSPGDDLDDNVSTPRGVAIKVIGVEGERLPDTEGDVTQDFVMVNGPAFLVPGPKKFLGNLKLLASTTDKAPGLKKALSAALRGTEKMIEAAGGESAKIKSLGGHPETHILGETFFSQAPMLFGQYMVKVSLVPISPQLKQLTDVKVDLKDKPNGLRESVIDYFSVNTAEWELRVQFCTDLEAMPIEDASVVWPEDQSPYIAVARVTAATQPAWNEALHLAVDDGMSFSPWHGIAAHRPIGAIMRVRKEAYKMSAAFRALRNNVVMTEPRNLDGFPVQSNAVEREELVTHS